MASPQPDRYTKISNELMEKIPQYKFNGTQLRILFVIFRYTYGFNRKEWQLSVSFIANAINSHHIQVKREIKSLIISNVLTVVVQATFNSTRVLSFNKNYEEWNVDNSNLKSNLVANPLPGSEKGSNQGTNPLPQPGNVLDTQEIHSFKDNIKNNIYTPEFEKFWIEYPRKKEKRKAYKCWLTRLKEKYTEEDLIKSAIGYKNECKANNTEEKFIKHPATFLGPALVFEEYTNYKPPKEKSMYIDRTGYDLENLT